MLKRLLVQSVHDKCAKFALHIIISGLQSALFIRFVDEERLVYK